MTSRTLHSAGNGGAAAAAGERGPAAAAAARASSGCADGTCGPDCFTLDADGFTCHKVMDVPEVWRVELLMDATFLPSVNAFVVLDGADSLVVDCGTPDPYNDTRLMRALVRLGVDPARCTLFCTHAHIDHTGLARELAQAGARVTVSSGTLADMRRFGVPAYRDAMAARLRSEGVGVAEAAELADSIWDHTASFDAWGIAPQVVEPGDAVRCGRWAFEVVSTPGHVPGHCILWLPERRLAFLGDAVLFACSTCIGFWGSAADTMGDQMRSLKMLAGMGIEHAFLGHGLQEGSVSERCLANLAHHERRSAAALAAVRERPGSTGFELVPHLGWRVKAGAWRETPALTRWFLASESIAHLDHLVRLGLVTRERGRYWPAAPQPAQVPADSQPSAGSLTSAAPQAAAPSAE